jgi:hypothetical protein
MAFALTTLTTHVPDYIAPSIPPIVLAIIMASVCVKLYFIASLCYKGWQAQAAAHRSLYFLITTLFFSLFSDMAWAAKFIHKIFFPDASYACVTFFIRIGWSSIALQHQYLSLFMQGLIQQKVLLTKAQKAVTTLAYLFCFYFVYTAFFDPHLTDKTAQLLAQKIIFNPPFEVIMVRLSTLYLVAVLVIPGIQIVIEHAHSSTLPKIVKKQLFIFLVYFVCPYLIIELLQGVAIIFSVMERGLYVIVGLATLLLIIALYYAINRIILLRFMNWSADVQLDTPFGTQPDSQFDTQFGVKSDAQGDPTITQLPFFISTLKQLSFAHSKPELSYITQQFFKTAFHIPEKSVTLHIPHEPATQALINSMLAPSLATPVTISGYLKQQRIFIFDNISCSNFYEPSALYEKIIERMLHLEADIFIPLYQKETVIGCILIKKSSRNSCFSKADRDKMIVFAHYLSSNIHLIATKSHETLVKRIRAATRELQTSQQELNLFKETVRHALKTERTDNAKKIGVLYFQNNLLTPSTQTADFFPALNQYALNQYDGLPLIRTIKQVARKVAATKVAHSELFLTEKTEKQDHLLISGSGQLNKEHAALICVQYAPHAEIIQKYSNLFAEPSDWYYLLFLHTTQVGHHINSSIKVATDYFLYFKLHLLKKLVTSASLFIHVHEKDTPTLIATINQLYDNPELRTTALIQTVTIESPTTAHTVGPLIFGDKTHPGLVNTASLVIIINAHWLPTDTQRALSAYVQEKSLKHDAQRNTCGGVKTRFVFISSESVQHSYFDRDFYLALKNNTLTIPVPETLPHEELSALIDGITQKLLSDTFWHGALSLNQRDKKTLMAKPPKSLYTLQKNIYDILHNKIKHNTQNGSLSSLAATDGLDTSTIAAIKHLSYLGKHALKDPEAMKLLWHSFGNYHTIARILSVDTASVYRACKKYGLL